MDKNRKTIFLVDDEMMNLALGKKALTGTYNVFTIDSGHMVLEMLENLHPDMILLDVNMPEMNGYEVIERLKSNKETANIPVIFLTALTAEETELKGLSLGAIDYITKPFSPQLLLKRIELHLLVEAQKQELIKQKRELMEQKQELLYFNNNLEYLVNEKTATVVELKNAILSTMAELVEYRDEITGGHIVRTQRYIKALMDEMKVRGVYADEIAGLDEELVLQSCQLHDVGKIAVSDIILNKPDKLTPEEFEIVKGHTTFGERVLNNMKEKTTDSDFLEYARIFAASHHEKWDGSGYPMGLKGEAIPLLGRIMAIGDVYDALVEPRPYKGEISHKEAVNIILEGRSKHFDPLLIDLFEEIHPVFEKIAAEVRG